MKLMASFTPEEAERIRAISIRPSTRMAIRGDEYHFFDSAGTPSEICLCCGINPGEQFKKGRK